MLNYKTGQWQILKAAGPSPAPDLSTSLALAGAAPPVSAPTNDDVVYMIGGGVSSTLWVLRGNTTAGLAQAEGGCADPFDLRSLHGVLMLVSWGVLLPLGVTIAR